MSDDDRSKKPDLRELDDDSSQRSEADHPDNDEPRKLPYAPNSDDLLIEAAENRPSSDSKYLSENSMKFMLKDMSHSSVASTEDTIQDRLDDVPDRLRRLIYDITALEAGEYLDDFDQNWNLLTDIPNRHTHSSVLALQRRRPSVSFDSPAVKVGFELGLALSSLTGTASEDQRGLNFLWGMALAYSTDNEHHTEEERKNFNDLQLYLDKQAERTIFDESNFSHPTSWPTSNKIENELTPRFFDKDSKIKKILNRYGLDYNDYTHIYVNSLNSSYESPYASPSEDTEKDAIKIIEGKGDEFGEYITMQIEINNEEENLHNSNVPGADSKDILKEIWEFEENENGIQITSEQIAKRLKNTHKKIVTQSLNRLSEDGKNPSAARKTTYKNCEVVSWSDGWYLTPYGRLLCLHLFKKNSESWIQRIAIEWQPFDDEPQIHSKKDEEILKQGIEQLKEKYSNSEENLPFYNPDK